MSNWTLHEGDCIPHMLKDMEPQSIDFSVFSPPFPAVYAYGSSEADIGNDEDFRGDAKIAFNYFYRGLLRVMKPGRVVMVHVAQVKRSKKTGGSGLFDFRGFTIRIAERCGFIYEYDWLVSKNPQSSAIRTKARELQFVGLEQDRANCRGALPDYLIKFRVPGDNAVPVDSDGEVSRNDWIQWAEACWPWTQIRETDTLNKEEARGKDDIKHIAPLQLGVIRRLVKLYTNPGELVFSPFTGMGSEGYESLKLGRRFYGCELKDEYIKAAKMNLNRAEKAGQQKQETLFA